MCKEFNAAVRSAFQSQLAICAPQFVPTKVSSQYAWPGERAFCWPSSETKYCWVSVIPSPKGYNEFSVEIGWSSLGRYPELMHRPSIASTAHASDVFQIPEFMCRLASICEAPDHWRVAPNPNSAITYPLLASAHAALAKYTKPEAIAAATPLVASAIQAFERFGMPFLTKYAA